jgi:hypothetical protein
MKLTKSALKQIIKEELLKEFAPSGGGDGRCEDYSAKMLSLANEVGELYKELQNNKNLYDTAVKMSKLPFVGFIGKNAMKNSNYQQDVVRTREAIDSKLLELEEHINGDSACKRSTPDADKVVEMINTLRAEMADDPGVTDAVSDALKGL